MNHVQTTEDIKGVVSASCCNKSKVVKRKFEDQDDTRLAPDADAAYASTAAAAGAADAATPRHPSGRGRRRRRAAPGGEEPPPAPSPAAKGEGCRVRGGWGGKMAAGKASG